MEFTFGTDPEFIIISKKTGRPISAINVIKRHKSYGKKIKGHLFYYDNVLAECAVKPANNEEEAINHIGECISILNKLARPHSISNDCIASYDQSQLDHIHAIEVGCMPDICAYQKSYMPQPIEEICNHNIRTCGGHIHIGHPSLINNMTNQFVLVYLLDILIGVPSVLINNNEGEAKRKQIYGQCGRFRIAGQNNTYGIEYRTPSNFWLRNPCHVQWIYQTVQYALSLVVKKKYKKLFEIKCEKGHIHILDFKYDAQQVKHAVDNHNIQMAEKLMSFVQNISNTKLNKATEKAINTPVGDIKENWQSISV